MQTLIQYNNNAGCLRISESNNQIIDKGMEHISSLDLFDSKKKNVGIDCISKAAVSIQHRTYLLVC